MLKLRAHLDTFRLVHCEQRNRRTANRRLPGDERSLYHEVLLPTVYPRVEQLHVLIRFRVDAGQVRSLVSVAVRASQREILETVRAAVLLCSDVLDMERKEGRRRLRQVTVLATILGAFANQPTGPGVHRDAYAEAGLRSERALACKIVTK